MAISVTFITPPFSGHLNPQIELAKYLKERGFEIRFITGVGKIELLQSLGYEADPILKNMPDALEHIASPPIQIKNNPILLIKQLKQNLALSKQIIKELHSILLERRPDIVIADFIAVQAGIVCEELGILWITTLPTPFILESQSGTPCYLGGLAPGHSILSEIRDFLGRALIRSFKKLSGLIFKKDLKYIGYQIYRKDGTESAYSPYSILGLGMSELEFPRDWPPYFKFIGPCCSSPEQMKTIHVPFGSFKKSVLITLGTHLEWAKTTLIEEVSTLACSFKEVLFVISLGKANSKNIYPIYQVDNVLAFDYFPYSQGFNNFDVIIHHGGAGALYASIKANKPSLVIPQDYDQFDFAARINYHKIGLRVKKLNSKDAIAGLHRLLYGLKLEMVKKMCNSLEKYSAGPEVEKEILRLLKR